jgi:SpoVK/Ycf46/Vps4 family AAA+-type ATPase
MAEGDLIQTVLGDQEPYRRPRRKPKEPSVAVPGRLRALPQARGELDLVDVRDPFVTFADLLLSDESRRLFAEVHLELRQEDLLVRHGVPARRTFLFTGLPGTGKSVTAEALADELGRQLATVNLSTLVSSFLGDTSKNISTIFDAASRERWVVLFDEFDAIGKERAEQTDHGELKRVVTAFLQQLDNFRGPSILVAATNHPKLLDLAVWRRFDEVLEFRPPDVHEIRSLLRLKLRSIPKESNFSIQRLASACQGLTQADVSRVIVDAYRRHLLYRPDDRLSLDEMLSAAKDAQRRTLVAEGA